MKKITSMSIEKEELTTIKEYCDERKISVSSFFVTAALEKISHDRMVENKEVNIQ